MDTITCRAKHYLADFGHPGIHLWSFCRWSFNSCLS